MKYDYMISPIDEHNEVALILCKKYSIKKMIVLTEPQDLHRYENLKNVYEELLPTCILERLEINLGDNEALCEYIYERKDLSIIINLTGGERINSLIMIKEAIKLDIKCVYVDLLKMKSYIFKGNLKLVEENFQDLNIEELTKLSGANIIMDYDKLGENKDIEILAEAILNNLDFWERYKKVLYNSNIFQHDYKDNYLVRVNVKELKDEEIDILNKCLKYLKDIGSINYVKEDNLIKVTFRNNYLKGFIFKSGTWLEVITKKVINEIKEIDEVKSGVEFFWSSDTKKVKNEIDVIAIKDSVLLCISCKDSEKYDEEALNELEVYSRKLGGKNVKKILVAARNPIKSTVIERAEKMDINIIVISKDIKRFKDKVIKIINN